MTNQLDVAAVQEMIGRSKFHQLFQPQVVAVDNDAAELTIQYAMSDALERQPDTDQWHGGAISAIIDTTGCYALALVAGEPLPTINFRTDYLRPAINTNLKALGKIRKAGRRVGVVDVDVFDDQSRLVAVGRASYAFNIDS